MTADSAYQNVFWENLGCYGMPNSLRFYLTFRHSNLLRGGSIEVLVAVGLSGILKGKQKLGVTLNSDKLGGIDFTKFSKLTMCSALEEA